MKPRFIALALLLITIKANCYYPLFLAQDALNTFPEKLIVQINSVDSEALLEKESKKFNFYRIKLVAEIKYVGETIGGFNKGDMINISYKTSELKPNAGNLDGYMPIKIPKQLDLCIVYLDENHTIDTYWGLQIITFESIKTILSNESAKRDKTPEWVKEGVMEILIK